jgi:hypothetical protein
MTSKALGETLDRIEAHRADVESTLRNQIYHCDSSHRRLVDLVQDATRRYVATGVAYPDAALFHEDTRSIHDYMNVLHCGNTMDHFRGLATEMGRVFISAHSQEVFSRRNGYNNTICLRLPKNKRMENMAASFMVAGPKIDDEKELNSEMLVARVDTKALWYFYFVGDQGKEFFEGWLEQCRTDPVFKICINSKR